jgi:hypothetical protein
MIALRRLGAAGERYAVRRPRDLGMRGAARPALLEHIDEH